MLTELASYKGKKRCLVSIRPDFVCVQSGDTTVHNTGFHSSHVFGTVG